MNSMYYAWNLDALALALDLGVRIVGGSLVALALWLLRYDIARRTIRRSGVTRFIAPLILLHLLLALRVTGDLLVWPEARRWGGLLNVLVLLVFIANTLRVIRRSKATQLRTTKPTPVPIPR
jgi:hypothetical protein